MCGRDRYIAIERAAKFERCGPNLILRKLGNWNGMLGADGRAIFAILLEGYSQLGAVPVKRVQIDHLRIHQKYGRTGEGLGS